MFHMLHTDTSFLFCYSGYRLTHAWKLILLFKRCRHGLKSDITQWVLGSEELHSYKLQHPDCSESPSLIQSCICDCKIDLSEISNFMLQVGPPDSLNSFCIRHQGSGNTRLCMSSVLWFRESFAGFWCGSVNLCCPMLARVVLVWDEYHRYNGTS